jgi:agmatine deiminase
MKKNRTIILAVGGCIVTAAALVYIWSTYTMKQSTSSHSTIQYTMPDELQPHEGTWLAWPHHHHYGIEYRDSLEDTWLAMTRALIASENVHIVAYDEQEMTRIQTLLDTALIDQTKIDFLIAKHDDVWIRDNGPVYVRDTNGNLAVQDWGFNGWGKKEPFEHSDRLPALIASTQKLPYVDLNTTMINEGGAVEIDGNGTLMATKSSILNANRNPGMSQAQAEEIFTKNLGVTKFIWLEGKAGLEITDMHIDGFARFGAPGTIVTMNENDLADWDVPKQDIARLHSATNKDGVAYKKAIVPLTAENVVTTEGTKLGYKGSYINYYVANTVVLVPNYNDINDAAANAIIQALYPNRTVVGIDVRNLYENGGMVHCVTQQQPY